LEAVEMDSEGALQVKELKGRIVELENVGHNLRKTTETLNKRMSTEKLISNLSTSFINIEIDKIDSVISYSLEAVGKFFDVDRSYIFLYSPDQANMHIAYEWCAPLIASHWGTLEDIDPDLFHWFVAQLKNHQAVFVPHVQYATASAEKQQWLKEGIGSIICVPMICRGVLIGFMGFDLLGRERDFEHTVAAAARIIAEIFANVLDRKHIELQLQKSEEQYKLLVENLDLGISLVDNDNKVVMANKAMEKFFKRPADSFIGEKFYDEFDSKAAEHATSASAEAISTGQPAGIETQGVRGDGSRFPVFLRAIPIHDNGGSPSGFIEVIEDISARKRAELAMYLSEQRFRAVADYTYHWEVWVSPTGGVLWTNPAVQRITGYTLEELMSMRDYPVGIVYHEDREKVANMFQQALDQKSGEKLEFRLRRKDGRIIWVSISWQAIYDKKGVSQGHRESIHDITARKKAEKRRAELRDTLATQNQQLEKIIYAASHDLRSGLVSIDGFSGELNYSCDELREFLASHDIAEEKGSLLSQVLRKDIPEAIEYIRTSVERMDSFLKGLLQLSRIGRAEMNIEPVDMEYIISEVIDDIANTPDGKKVTFNCADLPQALADEETIKRVFQIIIENAVKYTKSTPDPTITIDGHVENGKSIYSISDNGIGIPQDKFDEVFEIFSQLNPADNLGGIGLGLTIARRLIDRNNGIIYAESESSKGSTFNIILPGI
jgi:PAS domain S-box-containing protein